MSQSLGSCIPCCHKPLAFTKPTNQPTNRPTNRPTNQPTNRLRIVPTLVLYQPTNQSTSDKPTNDASYQLDLPMLALPTLVLGESDTEAYQKANGTFEGHAITQELEVLRDGATAVEHDNALVLLGGLNQESLLARESLLFDKSGVSSGVLPRLRVNRAWHAGLSFDRHDPPIAKLGAAVSEGFNTIPPASPLRRPVASPPHHHPTTHPP